MPISTNRFRNGTHIRNGAHIDVDPGAVNGAHIDVDPGAVAGANTRSGGYEPRA